MLVLDCTPQTQCIAADKDTLPLALPGRSRPVNPGVLGAETGAAVVPARTKPPLGRAPAARSMFPIFPMLPSGRSRHRSVMWEKWVSLLVFLVSFGPFVGVPFVSLLCFMGKMGVPFGRRRSRHRSVLWEKWVSLLVLVSFCALNRHRSKQRRRPMRERGRKRQPFRCNACNE